MTIDGVLGRFYYSPHNSIYYGASDGVFDIRPGTPPLFTQQFTAIDFDPPPTAQHCSNPIAVNGRAVDSWTQPFANVIPQPDGTCTLAIAQGNGAQAGVDLSSQGGENLEAFEAAFTARLTVQQAGPLTLHFYSDDGWILAIGKDALGRQPTRDPNSSSGSWQTAPGYTIPTSGWLTGYPVVGTDDQTSAPAENDVTVDFPAAGTFPMEVDYTECCQGELALTLGSQYGDPLLPGTMTSEPTDLARNCACDNPNAATANLQQPTFGHPFNSRDAAPGPRLAWTRTYNSQATGDADATNTLGPGWTDPYATHVVTPGAPGGEPGVAIISSPTGNRLRFQDLGSGRFRAFPGVDATLVQAGGVYTETLWTQDRVVFNAAGQATTMIDPQDHRLQLQYDSSGNLARIQDALNPHRYLALDYDPSGTYIVAVHDGAGRAVQYAYDPSTGDLTQVTDVMGRPTTYSYQNHLLTGITDALGEPVEQNAYDRDTPAGKAISQTLQDGRQLSVSYLSDATTITATGTDGAQDVTQVLYDPGRNLAAGIVENGVLVQQTAFDVNFSPSLVAGPDGNPTTVQSTPLGLPTSVTNALSGTVTTQYDPVTGAYPVTTTDQLGRQTVNQYDAHHNLVQRTTGITTDFPLGQTTVYTYTVRYPGQNWLEDVQAPNGVVTHNEYDALGQLITQTVGAGTDQARVSTFGYDAVGRLVTTTVGAGTPVQRTDVTRYNADNTLAQTIQNYTGSGAFDPAHPDQNVSTTYGYDALGRPIWQRDALGHYDVTHYNAAGQVDWTLRNLSPVQRDASGQPQLPATPPAFAPDQPDADVATLYDYDGLGRQTLITQTGILTGTFDTTTRTFADATTQVTRVQYDALDQPLTTTLNYRPGRPALPDVNVQSVTRYDPLANELWQRDELGRWTRIQYDPLDRPVTTTVNYENGDPLTVDPANQGWTNGTDTDLLQVTRYNADSSIAEEIDNDVDGVFTASAPITDRITQYAYDGEGRVITTTANADPATLGSRTDTNRQTVTTYDPLSGQELGRRDALGRWTSYQYDALGRVTETIANCRDSAGTPVAQGCASFDASVPDRNVPTQTRYDALGRPVETVDALGHVSHAGYDGLGQETTRTQNYVAGGPSTADTNVTTRTAYDALGRTTMTTDAVGAATSYAYDNLGQTVAITDPVGHVVRKGSDATGQQRWSRSPDGRFTVTQVDGLGRVVATIQNYQTGSPGPTTPVDEDIITRTVYDAAGRVVQTVDPVGHVTADAYDVSDDLLSAEQNVQSSCAATATDCNVLTQYAYDRAGHRIATTDPRGHTQRVSFDAADEPVAATDALTRTTR